MPMRALSLCELFERGIINEVWIQDGEAGLRRAPLSLERKQSYDGTETAVPGSFAPNAGGRDPLDDIICGVTVRFAHLDAVRGPGCDLEVRGWEIEAMWAALPSLRADALAFLTRDFDTRFSVPFREWGMICDQAAGIPCVNYPTPTAVDAVDGPVAIVPCAPASGTKFALGTTVVNCSATDDHSNTGHASFNVTVSDKTPPNLIVPAARSVYATTPTGVPNTVSGVVSFLNAASATDLVDGSPVITNNAPSFLPVGNLTITFGARDFSGNVTYKSVNLIVLQQPPPGTPPLVVPPKPTIPAQPTNVRITPLDGAVRIQWNAGGQQVMVTRSSSSNRSLSAIGDERVVYTGNGSSYTDRGLENGVEYRYVVMAVDAAGNHSPGVAGVVVPRRNLLKSPKDGARLRKAPKLIWARDAEAQYYNAQLLLNGKKILSVWPVRPTYALTKNWKYLGRKYTLKPGLYSWYVFPGYGARSAVHYGDLMGSRTFRIVR
jgi:hypothetical protein